MSMENKANQVRGLVINHCTRKDKEFLGGPPYTEQIVAGLHRQKTLLEEIGLPVRQRINLASVFENNLGNVVGYQSTTVIKNGFPTEYERKHIGLKEPLTYGILKYIVTHSERRDGGVARPLLLASLEMTAAFGISKWVTDVNSDNRPMIIFLRNHGFVPLQNWQTPNETKMTRMGTENIYPIIESLKKTD